MRIPCLHACETFAEVIKHSHLRTLELDQFCFEKLDQVRCLLSMLRRASSLILLDIKACSCKIEAFTEPVTKFWEKKNSWAVTLKQLQKVRVRSFRGSDVEIKLIQYVMVNSPVLEEITVEFMEKPLFDKHEVQRALQYSCEASTLLNFIGGCHESAVVKILVIMDIHHLVLT